MKKIGVYFKFIICGIIVLFEIFLNRKVNLKMWWYNVVWGCDMKCLLFMSLKVMFLNFVLNVIIF